MNANEIARIAALVGEPARTAMLLELVDGRALTARELAATANITPQTASRHLAQLVDAGLLVVDKQGRHRYHRLASSTVANMLEAIMQLASSNRSERPARVATGPSDRKMRCARMCYDHIAGRLGVAMANRLQTDNALVFAEGSGQVTDQLGVALSKIGLSLDNASSKRRALCRPCLDWSERRYHVAGQLGAALCQHLLGRQWIRRDQNSRVLAVTPTGARALSDWLGMQTWDWIQSGQSAKTAKDPVCGFTSQQRHPVR